MSLNKILSDEAVKYFSLVSNKSEQVKYVQWSGANHRENTQGCFSGGQLLSTTVLATFLGPSLGRCLQSLPSRDGCKPRSVWLQSMAEGSSHFIACHLLSGSQRCGTELEVQQAANMFGVKTTPNSYSRQVQTADVGTAACTRLEPSAAPAWPQAML